MIFKQSSIEFWMRIQLRQSYDSHDQFVATDGGGNEVAQFWHSKSAGAFTWKTEMLVSNQTTPPGALATHFGGRRFATILADPPWQFQNRTGKMAPEHKRLARYSTMVLEDIAGLPVDSLALETAHLYLWVPNALLLEGMKVMEAWGFKYKTNIVWHKIRKDGGPDGRGVGFYFRNVTELVLFGIRGKNARTLAPGRRQVNIIKTAKREHSRKPDELYDVIERCSPGPFLELFARGPRPNWVGWGSEALDYFPNWSTYANHSQSSRLQGF